MFEYHKKESPIISLLGMGGGIGSYIFTAADTGYEIARSLRFDSSSSAYLSRTPSSPGNRKTWTFSTWAKLTGPYDGTDDYLLIAYGSGSAQLDYFDLRWQSNIGVLRVGGYSSAWRTTTAVFRDPSAWYHIVLVWDTTQATADNRIRLYVNGVEQTDFSASSNPNPDDVTSVNNNVLHRIGVTSNVLLADCQLIDGSALEPTEFGTFDDYGVWQPKRYTGSKSGNSFHLPFSDTTSATTLGYDDSGNNNNWDVNGISVANQGYVGKYDASNSWAGAFDGNETGTWAQSSYSSSYTQTKFIFDTPLSWTSSIRVKALNYSGGGGMKINETDVTSSITSNGTNNWNDLTTALGSSGTVSSITVYQENTNYLRLFAIELDSTVVTGVSGTTTLYGVNNDSLLDSPSNADTTTTEDTGVGGELAGNYATMSPLIGVVDYTQAAKSNGNLQVDWSASTTAWSDWGLTSGKWYYETTMLSGVSSGLGNWVRVGRRFSTSYNAFLWRSNGNTTGLTGSPTFSTYATGDVLGVAIDVDNEQATFYKNGVLQGTGAYSYTTAGGEPIHIGGYANVTSSTAFNFGQRPYAYSAPSGFKTLNTANLPTPTIEDGSQYVGVATYTGNGGTPQTISSLNFEPDLLWFANRTTGGYINPLIDQVRGITKYLSTYAINPEGTNANFVTATSSTGFTVGSSSQVNDTSQAMVTWCWDAGSNSSKTYTVTVPGGIGGGFYIDGDQKPTINLEEGSTYTFDQSDSSNSGHPFRFSETSDGTHGAGTEYTTNVTTFGTPGSAGAYTRIEVAASAPTLYYYCSNHSAMGGQINTNSTAGASNFDGSIPSVVRANPTAGFSIVAYSGVGYSNVDDNFTVGHGLSQKPAMIIVKKRTPAAFWAVWHTAFGDPAASGTNTKYIKLNEALQQGDAGGGYLFKDASTSDVFGIGVGSEVNGSGSDFVAFCFAPIEGYSSFGSYTGNGSTDGPFVYTGFRPRWVMVKGSSTAGLNWCVFDTSRDGYNGSNASLHPNADVAESYYVNDTEFHIYSNGFKPVASRNHINNSGTTFIWAAFAENPFRSARAR